MQRNAAPRIHLPLARKNVNPPSLPLALIPSSVCCTGAKGAAVNGSREPRCNPRSSLDGQQPPLLSCGRLLGRESIENEIYSSSQTPQSTQLRGILRNSPLAQSQVPRPIGDQGKVKSGARTTKRFAMKCGGRLGKRPCNMLKYSWQGDDQTETCMLFLSLEEVRAACCLILVQIVRTLRIRQRIGYLIHESLTDKELIRLHCPPAIPYLIWARRVLHML
eukprot:scaffold7_cov378-Prasinococcus_capsulatus_cf.AAC.13